MPSNVTLTDNEVVVDGTLKVNEVRSDSTLHLAASQVTIDGFISAYHLKSNVIEGVHPLGKKESILRLYARDIVVTWGGHDKDGKFVSQASGDAPDKQNIALSHVDGDILVINRIGGFTGGVQIVGHVSVPESLTVANKDVGAELAALRAELDELKAKVG